MSTANTSTEDPDIRISVLSELFGYPSYPDIIIIGISGYSHYPNPYPNPNPNPNSHNSKNNWIILPDPSMNK